MVEPVGSQLQPAPTLMPGLKPDRKAWVWGCVQTCDDACRVSDNDLDWEFALIPRPGHPAGIVRRSKWPRRAREDVMHFRSCIRMQPESMLAQVSCSSPSVLIATHTSFAVSLRSPAIYMRWPTGSCSAGFALWRWSLPGSTGFL